MEQISWDDFEKVELRIGTIVEIEEFPEAKKPAYKIVADFGEFLCFLSFGWLGKEWVHDSTKLCAGQCLEIVRTRLRRVQFILFPFLYQAIVSGLRHVAVIDECRMLW